MTSALRQPPQGASAPVSPGCSRGTRQPRAPGLAAIVVVYAITLRRITLELPFFARPFRARIEDFLRREAEVILGG